MRYTNIKTVLNLILSSLLTVVCISVMGTEVQPDNAQPLQGGINVQSVPLVNYRWVYEKIEPVNVIKAGLDGVKFSWMYNTPIMYLISVPEGFDGFVALESDRNSDFRITAWPRRPPARILGRATSKQVSMGNTLSFKNVETKSSIMYLVINLTRMPSSGIPKGGMPFVLTVRNSNRK